MKLICRGSDKPQDDIVEPHKPIDFQLNRQENYKIKKTDNTANNKCSLQTAKQVKSKSYLPNGN